MLPLIETHDEWLDLVTDPKAYFDKILLSNVELKVSGGRQADPEALANLQSIERDSYLNLVAGFPVADPDCVPCRKMKARKGSIAIRPEHHRQYANYLIFNPGNLTLDEESIAVHKESYKVYADTPAKIEIVTWWETLCTILNQYHDKYHISMESKRLIAKALKLMQSEGVEGKFIVNQQLLSNEIINTK